MDGGATVVHFLYFIGISNKSCKTVPSVIILRERSCKALLSLGEFQRLDINFVKVKVVQLCDTKPSGLISQLVEQCPW